MKHGYFYLDKDKNPVHSDDAMVLAKHRGIVKQTDVGKYWVSTVFLGIDHNWGSGPPILFETMIFNHGRGKNKFDDYQTRCATWDEALEMHKKACEVVENARFKFWYEDETSPGIFRCGYDYACTAFLLGVLGLTIWMF